MLRIMLQFLGNKKFLGDFKEASPKSSVIGGIKTFPNKKGLVRRMTMIQNVLDRYDPGEYFTYPQRDEKVSQKFFRVV